MADRTIYGDDFAEELLGGLGDDTIFGLDGADTIDGDEGDDLISAGSDDDSVTGGQGDDLLRGGSGDDTMSGGFGEDILDGGSGDDLLRGGPEDDVLRGGSGVDTATYDNSDDFVTVDLVIGRAYGTPTGAIGVDKLISIENVTGSVYSDLIYGDGKANLLAGLDGDDLLDGRGGNDVLVGGRGNDTLIAGDGVDALSGGEDNDVYVVAGVGSGGQDASVTIEDSGGVDTVDMSGAEGGAVFRLGSGGTVDGRTIVINRGDATVAPLDLVFSQDLSGSFDDDLANVQDLVPDIVDAVQAFQPDVRFGVTSFVDKAISPFGSSGDYAYRTDLSLTTDEDALQFIYDSFDADGGGDEPESQLEALQQLNLRQSEVGWSAAATKVVVMFTDASYHEAGDNPGEANDGDANLEDNEDYPEIAAIAAQFAETGIIPIFAVTSGQTSIYEALVEELGVGAVVTLASDSSNIVAAVEAALDRVFDPTLIENAIGTDYADDITGTAFANLIDGAGGEDTLFGGKGNDSLSGGDGDDLIIGGRGFDVLEGGDGEDIFEFDRKDLGKATGARDVIVDFEKGADRIDLSSIAEFAFIRRAGFSGDGPEVRFNYAGDNTMIYGDVNGDRDVDFRIELTGRIALTASDFIL